MKCIIILDVKCYSPPEKAVSLSPACVVLAISSDQPSGGPVLARKSRIRSSASQAELRQVSPPPAIADADADAMTLTLTADADAETLRR